jgi:cytochrome c-type biogenesis protein CcmE
MSATSSDVLQHAPADVPQLTKPGLAGRGPAVAKIGLAAAVVALAAGFLIFNGLRSASVYYLTVSELQAKGPAAYQQPARVAGVVRPGSIQRLSGGLAVRFVLEDQSGAMPVEYRGVVPDIFGDHTEVVVEGRYTESGVFVAKTLLAKCPSRFEAEQ